MTKCPMCKNVDLHLAHYEDQLPVSECRSCGGAWLRANEYARWLATQTPGKNNLENVAEAAIRFPVHDSDRAAICPDCGHILRKYKVSSNLDFQLDRCSNCNGVWLDKNEWQALQAVDLQDEINRIFTQPWQKQIQDEISLHKLDALYIERFGAGDYARIQEIRDWLNGHPKRNFLIAYLLDKDPYSF